MNIWANKVCNVFEYQYLTWPLIIVEPDNKVHQ